MTVLSPSGLPYLTHDELAKVFNAEAFEELARARVRAEVAAYVGGGSGSGETARMNREAFTRWVFRPRILRDVTAVDTSTTVLGEPVRTPIMLAASGLHRLSHPDGELATARAAARAGALMMLSTSSSVPMADVARLVEPRWLQLYWMTDREVTRDIVRQAESHGFSALALTVDAPIPGWREAEFGLGDWDWQAGGVHQAILPKDPPPTLKIEPGITWRSLDWLRSITSLPLVLKGVLTTEDAEIAVGEGIRAIVVSNHGGRQLDYAMASLDALPPIVETVAGRLEVYLESGVRRGTDVLKALALGARGALIGRPVHWGLGAGGEAGVTRLLEIMQGELDSAMGNSGLASIDQINRDLVAPRPR